MDETKLATLDTVLAGLMNRYRQRVPDVEGIIQVMIAEKIIASAEDIENDHIAFRTMGVPQLGVQSLEKIFLHLGYTKRDRFDFPVKKLNAWWYAPPLAHYPRVFISELRVDDLTGLTVQTIRKYTDEVVADPADSLDLVDGIAIDHFLHSGLWRTPTLEDFRLLEAESEYAAWVIYNRYYLNHFTISVHNLPEGYNTIEDFNRFVESRGYRLNDSGGKSKKSGDELLIQSSTVAQMVDAEFSDGRGGLVQHRIPGSYVEFAERKILPQQPGESANAGSRPNRRDGFEANNADKIFESTYSRQTSRKQ